MFVLVFDYIIIELELLNKNIRYNCLFQISNSRTHEKIVAAGRLRLRAPHVTTRQWRFRGSYRLKVEGSSRSHAFFFTRRRKQWESKALLAVHQAKSSAEDSSYL